MGKKIVSGVAILLLVAMAVSVKLGFRKVDTYEVSKIEKVYKGTDDVRYFVFTDKGVIVKTDKGIFVKSNNKVMKSHSEKRRWNDRNSIWVYTEEYDYALVKYIVEPKEE